MFSEFQCNGMKESFGENYGAIVKTKRGKSREEYVALKNLRLHREEFHLGAEKFKLNTQQSVSWTSNINGTHKRLTTSKFGYEKGRNNYNFAHLETLEDTNALVSSLVINEPMIGKS
jgi:hypothetical protein